MLEHFYAEQKLKIKRGIYITKFYISYYSTKLMSQELHKHGTTWRLDFPQWFILSWNPVTGTFIHTL